VTCTWPPGLLGSQRDIQFAPVSGRVRTAPRQSAAARAELLPPEKRHYLTTNPSALNRSTRLMQGIPRTLHTSGIFGRFRLFVASSAVTTAASRTCASAITKGSAPDLFFRVSSSF